MDGSAVTLSGGRCTLMHPAYVWSGLMDAPGCAVAVTVRARSGQAVVTGETAGLDGLASRSPHPTKAMIDRPISDTARMSWMVRCISLFVTARVYQR
ncbi:hypothetical protein [Kineosporia sp. NBRC 101731]|uniref:hypothetical protein n=1 Tax=Kineosporia sp. NBRC 101731 TaxID=3032199 RepID=UPI0024A30029|nr:hypothetical protein [Kineosporia sp. NBRC 101731]GLY32055.1 hypothetical protein Kisp02_54200 [Kineosporia sp. NBRC 101731]